MTCFIYLKCASTPLITPLKEKQFAAGLDLGALLCTNSDCLAPVLPNVNMLVAYGITNNISPYIKASVISAITSPFYTEIGVLFGIAKPRGWVPGFSASPRLLMSFTSGFNNLYTEFFPGANVDFYWEDRLMNNFFIGFGGLTSVTSVQYYLSPHLGINFNLRNARITIEAQFNIYEINGVVTEHPGVFVSSTFLFNIK